MQMDKSEEASKQAATFQLTTMFRNKHLTKNNVFMQIKLQVIKVNFPVGSQQRKCFIVPLPKAAFLCRSRIKARQM